MNDFWFWFTRPLAEFLGSLVMIGSIFGLITLVYLLMYGYTVVKNKIGNWKK